VAISVGAARGAAVRPSSRARRRAIVRNPPLIAVLAGLAAPEALAPDVLLDTAHVLIYATVPAAFFMVGLTLGAAAEVGVLRFPPALTPPVAVAIALRLAVAPLLMIGFSALIDGVPDAYLLQAAMPAGVNSVVVAHAYGLDLKIAASAVAWTTMLVVLAGMIVPSVLRGRSCSGCRARPCACAVRRSRGSGRACSSCSAWATTTTRRPPTNSPTNSSSCGSSPTRRAA
jgi:predicted permease